MDKTDGNCLGGRQDRRNPFRLCTVYSFNMARRKEFDPDSALEKIVAIFWRLGYERTSLEILMKETGLSKQSIYDTFGDKRSLFFHAMRRYRQTTNDSLRTLFAAEQPVRDAFHKIFASMIAETREQHERGCLLLSANLSRAVNDREIADFLQANQQEVEQIFSEALSRAQKRGEIGKEKSPVALAKFFVATIQGMRALARLNHDRQELRQIASVAISSLD